MSKSRFASTAIAALALGAVLLSIQPTLACGSKQAKADCCRKGGKAGAHAMGAGVKAGSCTKSASSAKGCPMRASARFTTIGAVATPIPFHEAKRLVLNGQYICGRCTLQKLDFCQGFLKTNDGSLYPLLMNGMAKKMMKKRSRQLRVVAQVRRVGGVKFLEVKTFTTL